jgi:excisionase family DNA binding protein
MLELTVPSSFLIPIPAKLLFSRNEIVSITGLSLRTVAQLIADGEIRITRVGGRVFIPRAELLLICEIEPTDRG